jgi:diadenylate cyclase
MTADLFLQTLERLAPGTPIRRALGRIIQEQNGALVVLGNGPEVEAICSGGFELAHSEFSPARLAELAKMDGAIIVDDSWSTILSANVHLLPDASIATSETGARHRTAERVAIQTGKPVVAVSEDRRVATLFLSDNRQELQDPADLIRYLNQSLSTLERFRRRLDEAEERLTPLEVSDVVTNRSVVLVVQRAELVRRIGASINEDIVGLGGAGGLTHLQLADLMQGVDELRNIVVSDYVRPLRKGTVERRLGHVEAIPTAQIHDPEAVASALGFEHLDERAEPLGLRVLTQVPRLPDSIREAVARHFRGLQKMLDASVADLAAVSGVGKTRAQDLRRVLDRLRETTRSWDHDDG